MAQVLEAASTQAGVAVAAQFRSDQGCLLGQRRLTVVQKQVVYAYVAQLPAKSPKAAAVILH